MQCPLLCDNINDAANNVTDLLYQCARASRHQQRQSQYGETGVERWQRLIQGKDDLKLWNAINWKGEFDKGSRSDECPTDTEFKEYFEENLNPPETVRLNDCDFTTNVTIPILDEPISPLEITRQAKLLKPNKAPGPDGLSPGIFRSLPEQWLLLLASLFNVVFYSCSYPLEWSKAKLVTIYKKGDKAKVENYRGINVINSIAKLYDMILCSRLKQWYKPYREQAGA